MKNVKLLAAKPAKAGTHVRAMSQPGGLPQAKAGTGLVIRVINLLGYVTR